MRKLIRFVLFHEALTIVWAAGLTATIVLIYQEFSQAETNFSILVCGIAVDHSD